MKVSYSVRKTIYEYNEFRKDGNELTNDITNKYTDLNEFITDLTKENQIIYPIFTHFNKDEQSYPLTNCIIPIDIDNKHGLANFINRFYYYFEKYMIIQYSRSYPEKFNLHGFIIFDNSDNEINEALDIIKKLVTKFRFDKSIYGSSRYIFTSPHQPRFYDSVESLTYDKLLTLKCNEIAPENEITRICNKLCQ